MRAMDSRLRRAMPVLALGVGLLAPAPAHAVKDLWATVNACDTPTQPNVVGIRASMPGTGAGKRLYMRFEVQWYDRARRRFVASGSSTRWVRVGSGAAGAVQAGYSFQFADPPAGEQFVMRGLVNYRWTARTRRRARGRGPGRRTVVRTAKRITRADVLGVQGGDPPGRSTALCVIEH